MPGAVISDTFFSFQHEWFHLRTRMASPPEYARLFV